MSECLAIESRLREAGEGLQPSTRNSVNGIRLRSVSCRSESVMIQTGLHWHQACSGNDIGFPVWFALKKLKPGDLVACEEMWYCGDCDPCRMSYFNHCEYLEEMGFTHNGGFEQYMRVHQKFCWKINEFKNSFKREDQIFEAGSLIEPACVSYNGMFVRAGGFRPGSDAAVWGAGPIGLSAIGLAKAAGASKIIAFEFMKERSEIARKIGANHAFNPEELAQKGTQPWEKVMEVTDGKGVEMHIEAAGDPATNIPQAEKSLSIGGKIVAIGRADKAAPVFFELY
jgi:threonine dehydrogenase-like Zn-dependent dehydrogenase